MTYLKRMMSSLNASNESIDYQDDSWFNQLSSMVQQLRLDLIKCNKYSELDECTKKHEINSFLKKRFGMDIELGICKGELPNAYVTPPVLDNNHPLVTDLKKRSGTYKELIKKHYGKNNILRGEVDLKKAKVSGDFSKIKIEVKLSRWWFQFNKDADFNAENSEVAAVILHEIGHGFTYFEYLSRSLVRNFLIQAHLEEFMQVKTKELKVKCIMDMKKNNILPKNTKPEDLVEEDGNGNITRLCRMSFDYTTFDDDFKYTNQTNSEVLADQFVMRMGGGEHQIIALNKIYKYMSDNYNNNRRSYYTMVGINVAALTYLTLTGSVVPAIILMGMIGAINIMLSSIGFHVDYDNAPDRANKMKRELIGQIKKWNIDEDILVKIVRQYDVISEEMEKNKLLMSWWQRFGLSDYINDTITNWFGSTWFGTKATQGRISALEKQNEIERLINNELYIESARMRTQ